MKEQAEALLLELAAGCASTRTVAARLVMLGCHQPRRPAHHCSTCPVAQFLWKHGLVSTVNVTYANGHRWGVLLPHMIRLFVAAFDAGQYPELVA